MLLFNKLIEVRTEVNTQSSILYAKSLDILGILDISGNTLIISIIMLYITTYIAINSLSRIIRTYIIFFITLPILISTFKTNNLDDISRYTLNLALNSRLR